MEKLPLIETNRDLRRRSRIAQYSSIWTVKLVILLVFGTLLLSHQCHKQFGGKHKRKHGHGVIKWKKCGDNFECGRLGVPLNYSDPHGKEASLSVIKYLATNHTHRIGSLLLNPGGPGGSGVAFVYNIAKEIATFTDGRFDIVSWDPRGINKTEPAVKCFKNATEEQLWTARTEIFPHSESDKGLFEANLKGMITRCFEEMSPAPVQFMSTAYVVRDMVNLYTALGDDALTYWGFSYGSVVGNTFANMFPEKVRALIVDGVVDATLFSSDNRKHVTGALANTEDVFAGLISECENAGPERCALARNEGPEAPLHSDGTVNVRAKLETMLQRLRTSPVVFSDRTPMVSVDDRALEQHLFQALYKPKKWNVTAENAQQLWLGNATFLYEDEVTRVYGKDPFKTKGIPDDEIFDNSHQGGAAVQCLDADAIDESELETSHAEFIENIKAKSPSFYRLWAYTFGHLCYFTGKFRAQERFTGPWNHTTSHPVLVIGNTYDPVTPLASAKMHAEMYGDSGVLVQQDGYGHCTLSETSKCTANIIRKYLLDQELPAEGDRFCKVDGERYPGKDSVSVASDEPAWLQAYDRLGHVIDLK